MLRTPFQKSTQTLLMSASLVLASAFPVASFYPAYSQGITTGTIVGSVVDSSGAVIPGATIVATRAATGTKLMETADQKGDFSFRNVPSGTYVVTISASGFADVKVENVPVAAGQASNIGAKQLGLGSASTNVQVSGANTSLLQTTESQISTTFSSAQIEDLPLNGSLDNLALLTPGVAIGHDDSFSNSSGFNLSINGNRSRSNNYEIDGQSNNDNSVGGPQIFFANQDAIQEVQVITTNYQAQYGRNMGGVINYITKSGTNQFHGTGYEYYTGSHFDALANGNKSSLFGYCAPGQNPYPPGTPPGQPVCAAITVPRYVENRWGGTFGGPILKDKLWGFGSTDWDHQRNGFNPYITSVASPTSAGLAVLAAAFPNNPAITALSTEGPFSALVGATPAPGTGTSIQVTAPNGATIPVPAAQAKVSIAPLYNEQEELGRLDWQPGEKDHLFLRYIYQKTGSFGNLLGDGYAYDVPGTTHSVGADWAHTFSSSWVNQVRYSFQQSKLFFDGGTQPSCTSAGLATCVASVGIQGGVGLGYATNLPQGRVVKVTQAQDNANWTHGAHSVSFGGDFTYQNSPNTFLPDYNGGYSYSSLSSFLQDAGTLTLGNGNPVIPFTEPDFGLYVQDDWKVTPSLTLNLGFRYEFFSQAVNTLHNETVKRETGSGAFWDQSLPLSQRTYPYTNQNWKNLEPRVGFAYNPAMLPKAVVRGAYGIQYDPSFYNIFLNSATAAPVINLGTVTCAGNCLPNGGLVGSNVRTFNLDKIPTGAGVSPAYRNQTNNPPTFVNPREQTYSLGVQYQLPSAVLAIGYVGSHVSRNFLSANANPYLLPIAQNFPNVVAPGSLCQDTTSLGYGRLNCNQGNVRTRNNNAFSNYNALEVQLQSRAYHGATVNASYTYSRVIDNADEIFAASSPAGSSSSPAFAQNPLQTDIPERGVANFSYPNLASVGLNYALPFFTKEQNLKGRLLGGYEVNINWAFNNGESWTANQFYLAAFSDPTANSKMNTTSYCDSKFDPAFVGLDACRPVLSNVKAPVSSVGVYVVDPTHAFTTAGTGYYNYTSTDTNGNLNAPIAKNQVHWLYNNRAYANLVGNPYPGSARNITRGQSYDNVDASVVKTTKIRDGVAVKLYVNAFNALNRAFLGNPDTGIDDGAPFGTNRYNSGTYSNGGTGLPASRALQFGGEFVF